MKRSLIVACVALLGRAMALDAATNEFIPGEGFNTLHLTATRELSQIVWRADQLIYRTGAIGNWEEEVVTTTEWKAVDPGPGLMNESTYRYADQAAFLLDSAGVPHVFVQSVPGRGAMSW